MLLCERFSVSNGLFVPAFSPVTIGVMGTYYCDPGYVLEGNRERVCTVSNEWSGEPAQCIEQSSSKLYGSLVNHWLWDTAVYAIIFNATL